MALIRRGLWREQDSHGLGVDVFVCGDVRGCEFVGFAVLGWGVGCYLCGRVHSPGRDRRQSVGSGEGIPPVELGTMSDLDEWRYAVADLDEAERQTNCGHTNRNSKATCRDCGDTIDEEGA